MDPITGSIIKRAVMSHLQRGARGDKAAGKCVQGRDEGRKDLSEEGISYYPAER